MNKELTIKQSEVMKTAAELNWPVEHRGQAAPIRWDECSPSWAWEETEYRLIWNSDVIPWPEDKDYQWAVINEDGVAWFWKNKPFVEGDHWVGSLRLIEEIGKGFHFQDWKDSLIERPGEECKHERMEWGLLKKEKEQIQQAIKEKRLYTAEELKGKWAKDKYGVQLMITGVGPDNRLNGGYNVDEWQEQGWQLQRKDGSWGDFYTDGSPAGEVN